MSSMELSNLCPSSSTSTNIEVPATDTGAEEDEAQNEMNLEKVSAQNENISIPKHKMIEIESELRQKFETEAAQKQKQEKMDRKTRVWYWFMAINGMVAVYYTVMTIDYVDVMNWGGYNHKTGLGITTMVTIMGLMWLNLVIHLVLSLVYKTCPAQPRNRRAITLILLIVTNLVVNIGLFVSLIVPINNSKEMLVTYNYPSVTGQFGIPLIVYALLYILFGLVCIC